MEHIRNLKLLLTVGIICKSVDFINQYKAGMLSAEEALLKMNNLFDTGADTYGDLEAAEDKLKSQQQTQQEPVRATQSTAEA